MGTLISNLLTNMVKEWPRTFQRLPSAWMPWKPLPGDDGLVFERDIFVALMWSPEGQPFGMFL
jgi:hypothetical protein